MNLEDNRLVFFPALNVLTNRGEVMMAIFSARLLVATRLDALMRLENSIEDSGDHHAPEDPEQGFRSLELHHTKPLQEHLGADDGDQMPTRTTEPRVLVHEPREDLRSVPHDKHAHEVSHDDNQHSVGDGRPRQDAVYREDQVQELNLDQDHPERPDKHCDRQENSNRLGDWPPALGAGEKGLEPPRLLGILPPE